MNKEEEQKIYKDFKTAREAAYLKHQTDCDKAIMYGVEYFSWWKRLWRWICQR